MKKQTLRRGWYERGRVRSSFAMAAVFTVAILTGACPGDQTGAALQAQGGLPECPGNGFVISSHGGRIEQLPLVDPITDIPEFHDCQQFIKADGSYDTRYAIFAIAKLDSLELMWTADSALAPQGQRVGLTAGVIYSWGGTYANLGIQPEFNCLVMWREQGSWKASMVPIGASTQCPDQFFGPSWPGETALVVHQSSAGASYSGNDYPPVARWDWDSTNSVQTISIKCVPSWCDIGPTGFVSPPPQVSSATFPRHDAISGIVTLPQVLPRTVEVKGWYDVQRLAVSVSGGPLTPSSVIGTLMPHYQLGALNSAADFHTKGPWVPVAYANLTAHYQSRLEFDAGMNRISTCLGDKTTFCAIPPGATIPASCPTGGVSWWMKIESSSGTRYSCAIQRTHLGLQIAATARWRWDANDETVWFRCTQGCCEVQ